MIDSLYQSFRIAIKLKNSDATHYVIRTRSDLYNMLTLIEDVVDTEKDIEYIKWVPIPALEEV